MVVADGLAPISRQVICNHQDVISQSENMIAVSPCENLWKRLFVIISNHTNWLQILFNCVVPAVAPFTNMV